MKTSTQTYALEQKVGIRKAVEIICELGYDSIDYSFFGSRDKGLPIEKDDFLGSMESLRKLADSYGVAFSQAHAPFASFREGDEEFNEWVKPLIIRSIEAAGLLGVENIVIHPFTMKENQKQANMDFYNSLLPYAEKHDVRIALENLFGWDQQKGVCVKNVCSDAEELADYVDTLDSEYAVACLDIGHCGLVGENAAEMIRSLGKDRLKCLHVHDNDMLSDRHIGPFMGNLDFPGIMKALKDIGYEGEMTLEADNFLHGFPVELVKDASLLMYKSAVYLAEMFENS